MKRVILLLLLTGSVVLGLFVGWFYLETHESRAPSQAVDVMIPKGMASGKIATLLQQRHVIGSSLAFRLKLRLDGNGNRLRSGLYRFADPATMEEIIDRLSAGDVMHFQVTVPEGLRTDQVLTILAKQTHTDLQLWQRALAKMFPVESEGYLLPETYQYTKPVQIVSLLQSMVAAQQRILAELSEYEPVRNKLRIMASIVEKETAVDRERPLVAAVIANRLHKGMPLQMDPTVIYGIYRTRGAFSGNITKQDLRADTPWSTYTRKGLPPTPICNPGAASLRAAAAPATVPFLYFVADGSGGHQFAATLADHQANVERWLRIERKRNASGEQKKGTGQQ